MESSLYQSVPEIRRKMECGFQGRLHQQFKRKVTIQAPTCTAERGLGRKKILLPFPEVSGHLNPLVLLFSVQNYSDTVILKEKITKNTPT